MNPVGFVNSNIKKKRVLFHNDTGSSVTVQEGYPFCYDYSATENVWGYDTADSKISDYTADGGQNEGKFLRVHRPATADFPFFAGVASKSAQGKVVANGDLAWIEIQVPNGAIMNVWSDVSVTAKNNLYIANGSFDITTTSADGALIGIATETVDRSGTSGVVQAKVIDFTASEAGRIDSLETLASDNAVAIASVETIASDNAVAIASVETIASDNTVAIASVETIASDNTVAIASVETIASDNLVKLQKAASDALVAWDAGDTANVSDLVVSIDEFLTAFSDALG